VSTKTTVVAEIGCNHQGRLDTAVEMIKVAAEFCKVDVVKFQKRTNSELLSPEEYAAPHPSPTHSFGSTYGEHREFLEFDLDQHGLLIETCKQCGIEYSVSVWDIEAARQMSSLAPRLLKVPSASNLDFEMLQWLASYFEGEIHLSLGMTTREEERLIFDLFNQAGRAKDLVLYACTSAYPVPFEDVCLLEIRRLIEEYGAHIKGIGFSGHHLGIAADVAALALGARYFERHFTLNRTLKGTDHAASLEPDGLRRVVRDVRNVLLALTPKREEILEIEKCHRSKLKRKLKA